MDRCLNESDIQGISMSKPFIREPALVNRWLDGDSPRQLHLLLRLRPAFLLRRFDREAPKELKPAEWFGCYLDRKKT
jgi:hypothetical protein